MEHQNAYYTPKQEDLFVGYECEISPLHDDSWVKIILGTKDLSALTSDGCEQRVRTLYLTKEQIKTEGWIFSSVVLFDTKYGVIFLEGFEKQVNENFWYKFMVDDNNLLILSGNHYIDEGSKVEEQIFKGAIKSINEFRKLMVWLGINCDICGVSGSHKLSCPKIKQTYE